MSANAIGVLIGAAVSLLTSWIVAEGYFRRQRNIDDERQQRELQLAFNKLVNAYFPVFRKRLKRPQQLREAMFEYETKLKIYRPDWDAKEMMEGAAEQAQHTIDEHPEEFEDI